MIGEEWGDLRVGRVLSSCFSFDLEKYQLPSLREQCLSTFLRVFPGLISQQIFYFFYFFMFLFIYIYMTPQFPWPIYDVFSLIYTFALVGSRIFSCQVVIVSFLLLLCNFVDQTSV